MTRLHEIGRDDSWQQADSTVAWREGDRSGAAAGFTVTSAGDAQQGSYLVEETPDRWDAQGGGHWPVGHLTHGTYLSATGRGVMVVGHVTRGCWASLRCVLSWREENDPRRFSFFEFIF
jgi:hypothetical protein